MKNILYKFRILLMSACIMSVTFSCKKDEPSPGNEEKPLAKMTVLLYAVVSDLNIESDKREILQGAANIDLEENNLFVYQVRYTGLPELLELTRDNEGNPIFQVVKVYDREQYSTDPARISSVIEDMQTMGPAENYGMIFWSHGTGWSPSFSNHGVLEQNEISLPSAHAFGYDIDLDRDETHVDKTDIDELADALPDNLFRYIWFDVCYMGGIETVYQLRNKCEYFIGMPTEDAGNGMPYQYTIPYLLKENPDCISAAKAFFNYYESGEDSDWNVATVGVCYMPAIEPVADYCRKVYIGAEMPSSFGLQKYSRGSNGPFYDFGQYTRRMAVSKEDAPDFSEFEEAMDRFVVYKAATKYDFSRKEIDQDNYSGLSCHLYNPEKDDEKTEFYRSLDWFKRTYE